MDNNRSFWDRHAKLYTPIQEKSNRSLFPIVIPLCLPYLTGDSKVLELACGSGQYTRHLAGKAGSWEATDFSPRMVEEARKRQIPGAVFSVQDATDLPYGDGSFDLVLIANALHVMPEPEKALREIHRVLKPGGILLAPTFIYEGKMQRLKLRIMEIGGFRPFYKWTQRELIQVVEGKQFQILQAQAIPAKPAPECFLAAKSI